LDFLKTSPSTYLSKIHDGVKENILEMERRFQFRYLPHNSFENPEDRLKVETLGTLKFESGAVSAEALELGLRFAREIQEAYLAHVSIRWVSDQVGYGCFAEEEIEKGAFVGEYTGIVRENNRRYTEPLNNYCYEYPILDSLGRSFVIDATDGNLTRFINHSSRPNLRPVYAFFNGFYHCIFFAIQSITRGSQLSYDYGQSYWYMRGSPEQIL
jgi:hypothetical protein